MACTFVNSLIHGSYTETGEINIWDVQDEVIREATTLQKISLASISVCMVFLLIYAFCLHRKIESMAPQGTLLDNAAGGELL
jgi:hypothetical protein